MGKVMRALGLMSGTSLDGIDVALIDTDGESHVIRGPSATYPYSADMRQLLANAISDARVIGGRDERVGSMNAAEIELTRLHAEAIADFLRQHDVKLNDIGVIGFHGQTVLHKPVLDGAVLTPSGREAMMTVQLGHGQLLADLTGCRVVYDMRAADCDAGGQGAPLVPAYHRALVAKLPQRPLVVVNIGGVSNVTYVGADGRLIAFDAGPGNALLDDWMAKKADTLRDEGGATAARGTPDDGIVHAYLGHDYFKQRPPKSLDRNTFALQRFDGLNLEDGAATLAAFTAASIAKAREHLPAEPELWIVSGGGRHNRTIMRMLAETVENAVVPAEAAGLDGDSVEAEAWAYLAVRALRRLPITFPETTGVTEPLTGGIIAEPGAAASQ